MRYELCLDVFEIQQEESITPSDILQCNKRKFMLDAVVDEGQKLYF